MKKIKIWSILLTIVFGVCFSLFVVFLILDMSLHSAIISAVMSIMGSIVFGLWISYIFQYMNDKERKTKNGETIKIVRNREFSKIRSTLSDLVRSYSISENTLVHVVKGLKTSFDNGNIDINNLTFNLFVFSEIRKDVSKYSKDKNIEYTLRQNIDLLFFKIGYKDNLNGKCEGEPISYYGQLVTLTKECEDLNSNMENLNLFFNLDIFTKDEMNAFYGFKKGLEIYLSSNYIAEYEIVDLFKHIVAIQSFVKPDIVPACRKVGFLDDLERKSIVDKNILKEIDNWEKENKKKVNNFLNESFINEEFQER